MNSRLILIFAVFAFVSIHTCAQEASFTATADKKFDGNKIVIYNNRIGVHDSAFFKDGRLEIKVPFKGPTVYYFYSELERTTKGGYSPFGILVTQPGNATIKADVENFGKSTVGGSKDNDLFQKFTAINTEAQQMLMDKLYQKYGKEFVNNRKPDTTNSHYKELVRDYQDLSQANAKDKTDRLKELVKSHPESFTAIYLLNGSTYGMEASLVEELYASLSPKYKDTREGKSIASVIEAKKITAIGKVAPDFSQPDTLGNGIKLSSLRGKYVLVDFWASWCGPCRAENPNLVKTFNRFKDKGFTVLGISLDQPGKKDAWIAAIHKDNLSWTQVSDLKFWDNDVAVLYGVKSIPTNLLLDPQGKIIAKDLRGDDLSKTLEQLLANN